MELKNHYSKKRERRREARTQYEDAELKKERPIIPCETLEWQIMNLHREQGRHDLPWRARQEGIDTQNEIIQELPRVKVRMERMEKKEIKERSGQEEDQLMGAQGEKLTKLSQEMLSILESFSDV